MEQPPCPLQLPVPGASLAADQRRRWLHNDLGPFTDLLAEEAKPQAKPNPVEADDFGGSSCTCTEAAVLQGKG